MDRLPRHLSRQGGGIFGQSPKKGNARVATLPMTLDCAPTGSRNEDNREELVHR
jgi:hypothetical protein